MLVCCYLLFMSCKLFGLTLSLSGQKDTLHARDECVGMNGTTHKALCDVLDEKEPAAGTNANEDGQTEDLAVLLQGSRPPIRVFGSRP